MSLDVHQLDQILLVGAAITLVAILAVRVSVRAGVPSLLLYLLMGVLIGESVLGVEFEADRVANALGFAALAVILAEGGLTTSWHDIRPSLRLGALLATVGIVVGISVMAVATHVILGLPWQLAVLLGAVTAPTDSAAVFSVLRRVPLPRRISGVLEAESGFNDAPTVILVTLVSSGAALDHGIVWVGVDIAYQLVIGVAVGLAVGFGGGWVMRRAALPASGLYPLAVLCLCFVAYGGAASIHTSGFAAVYVAALVLGNVDLPHRAATRSFSEGIAWLAQIGLFVMLGLLASPGEIDVSVVLAALVAGFILTFVARPLSVAASALFARHPVRDLVFLSWAGLRGAVPIVLATIPRAEGTERSSELFHVVFVLVVIYTLLTAPTLPAVARRLGVAVPEEPRDLDVEAAPLERIAADLLQVSITLRSRMHGVEVAELRLPVGASVSLIVREGHTFVPDGRTVLRRGDNLLIVTPRRQREQVEDRLRVVSRRGRLGSWGS